MKYPYKGKLMARPLPSGSGFLVYLASKKNGRVLHLKEVQFLNRLSNTRSKVRIEKGVDRNVLTSNLVILEVSSGFNPETQTMEPFVVPFDPSNISTKEVLQILWKNGTSFKYDAEKGSASYAGELFE